MNDHTFDLEDHGDDNHSHMNHHHHHHDDSHDDAAEAVLASLRAVINDPNSHSHIHVGEGEGEDGLTNDETLQDYVHHEQEHQEEQQQQSPTDPSAPQVSNVLLSTIEEGLNTLNEQALNDQSILAELNSANAIQRLVLNIKALTTNNKKVLDTLKDLIDQIKASHPVEQGDLVSAFTTTSDPDVSATVSRAEYDLLKSRYDALVASGTGGTTNKRERKSKSSNKQSEQTRNQIQGNAEDQSQPSTGVINESIANGTAAVNQASSAEGRKKRSIKLEHLVHKMANRRLGVEYLVSNFESKGSKELPDPTSDPVKAENSINGIDEFRPDYASESKSDINHHTIKPFIDQVTEDCKEAWKGALAAAEPEIDDERISTAVQIYWTRLCKRYDEESHRKRGEVHRDELSRRKQNSYRRQQSLLARRLAAFDSSPLNVCKLRALYRTLLTIDFSAPTQDSPDPLRSYTLDEWNAYRKLACESRAAEAHEVIDQFWLSGMARQLIVILDVYSADMNARARKKGRPKQPNPTFHLPRHLWDERALPTIRPKDENGLPKSGEPGIVLFKFHVDEKVQNDHPEWAQGLYENPPIPDEDINLPSLPEVMSMGIYGSLKPLLKDAKEKMNPKVLTPEECQEVLDRVIKPDNAIEIDQSILDAANLNLNVNATSGQGFNGGGEEGNTNDDNAGDYTTILALSSIGALPSQVGEMDASNSPSSPFPPPSSTSTNLPITATPTSTSTQLINPFTTSTSNPLVGLSGITEHVSGPSPGSSMRARKLGKRSVFEVPGGAATPVPINKKRRSNLSLMRDTGDDSNSSLVNLDSIALNGVDGHSALGIEESEYVTGNTDNGPGPGETLVDINDHVNGDEPMNGDDDLAEKLVQGEVQNDAEFLNSL